MVTLNRINSFYFQHPAGLEPETLGSEVTQNVDLLTPYLSLKVSVQEFAPDMPSQGSVFRKGCRVLEG
jgi:hypothetical protein